MSKILCIYHGNCPDGFAAAWVVSEFHGHENVELYPALYNQKPPDVAGREVFMVDFSYPREEMIRIINSADWVKVYDHHKTAQEALRDLSLDSTVHGVAEIVFDMNRSGAGITWDELHPDLPRPWLVDYVEDRDIWNFNLPSSHEISLYIRAVPYKLNLWDDLANQNIADILQAAQGCQHYLNHYTDNAEGFCYPLTLQWFHDIAGLQQSEIIAVNVTYTGVSDVLHTLLERHPDVDIALGWFVDPRNNIIRCSLRSRDGIDCSVIARSFGGGGHTQASGFVLPLDKSKILLPR